VGKSVIQQRSTRYHFERRTYIRKNRNTEGRVTVPKNVEKIKKREKGDIRPKARIIIPKRIKVGVISITTRHTR